MINMIQDNFFQSVAGFDTEEYKCMNADDLGFKPDEQGRYWYKGASFDLSRCGASKEAILKCALDQFMSSRL